MKVTPVPNRKMPEWLKQQLTDLRFDVQSVQKIKGRNIRLDEHPGKGTVVNADRVALRAPSDCPPPVPDTFSLYVLLQGGSNPDFSHTLNCTPADFPSFLAGVPSSHAPNWLQSFSPDWYSFWFGSPPLADGHWCEEDDFVSLNVRDYNTAFRLGKIYLRYGIVNGNTGWTALAVGSEDQGGSSTGLFNHFLGSTLNGTIVANSIGIAGTFTYTWIFTQP